MATDRLCDWVRLSLIEGVGPARFQSLLLAFGSPGAALGASRNALTPVVGEKTASAIVAGCDAAAFERTMNWCEMPGNRIVCFEDDDYPACLKAIDQPPSVLYCVGKVELLRALSIAMVGSRRPTPPGVQQAEQFAQGLSTSGLTVISGLAYGIDAAVHRGALTGIGSTVAVMATGADLIYPRGNKALAFDIADQGLLISELALGTPPRAQQFPRRNRIISGLSMGVLVVEATMLSGSLITARCALEQGREVFAMPGPISSPQSKGCHSLIKQGAKLVDSLVDVLEEVATIYPSFVALETLNEDEATSKVDAQSLGKRQTADEDASLSRPTATLASGSAAVTETHESDTPLPEALLSTDAAALLTRIGDVPIDIDALAALAGMSIGTVQGLLLQLEMTGDVERLLSGRYRRSQKSV